MRNSQGVSPRPRRAAARRPCRSSRTTPLPPSRSRPAAYAEALGTTEAWKQWAGGFDAFAEQERRQVQAAWPDRRAVVQKMQRSFAEWLGFEVVGEFGPAEPSPALVLELIRTRPAVVIDNYHNPSGRAIAESLKVPYAALINFPGKDGTRSIEDLYGHNVALLVAAAARR